MLNITINANNYMDKQDKLRLLVKTAKILNKINYKDIAIILNIQTDSVYKWIAGKYNLSADNYYILYETINDIINN